MIELVFHDGTTYALKCVKSHGECIGGIHMKLTMDQDGNQTTEAFKPEPYTGPKIDGSPDEVAGVWLAGSVGDLSNLGDWKKRITALNQLLEVYEDAEMDSDQDWVDVAAEQAQKLVERLQSAAKCGEAVRIWWSDAADESCGFYWAMALLRDSIGAVTAVKVPRCLSYHDAPLEIKTTGDLPCELFSAMLVMETPVSREERQYYANCWQTLVKENAPLRAVINGTLCSVPETFYDFILHQAIPGRPVRVAEVIGTALANSPSGVGDWWYATRLRKMIETGAVSMLEHKKPFYGSLIQGR